MEPSSTKEIVIYQIRVIRLRLEKLLNRNLVGETWRKWKKALKIAAWTRFCSKTEAKLLVTVGIMKREKPNCRIGLKAVYAYYLSHKDHILSILRSYQFEHIQRIKLPLNPVFGHQLKAAIYEAAHIDRCKQTFRNWVRQLDARGLITPSDQEYSHRIFYPKDLEQLVTHAHLIQAECQRRGKAVGQIKRDRRKSQPSTTASVRPSAKAA
jgi:hypothetical protein